MSTTPEVRPSDADTPRLSLVLPCYNGAGYIEAAVRKLFAWLEATPGFAGTTEVIVVDDGSSDDTPGVVQRTGLPLRFLRLERNRGKGAAVRQGMLEARGRFRIFMDSDLPFELGAIERMLRYLDFKEFHICIGSRTARGGSYRVDETGLRRLTSSLFAELVGRMIVTGVRDTQCGFKGFRSEVAEYLFRQARVDRFAFDVELLYLAFKNGFDVKTIPVQVVTDTPSTLRVTRDGLSMLIEVMKLPLRYHRGEYRLYDGEPSR